jgi:predicted dehydrogenase
MNERKTLNVGILGCGSISDAYCGGLKNSSHVNLVACADRNIDVARTLAERHKLRGVTIGDLIDDPTVDIVVNLTPPVVHAEIGLQVLNGGKHLYQEKPLATTIDDARLLIAEADRLGLRIGCAPDTFLGAAHQACRAEIDSGSIGQPIGGSVHMISHGMESWHPNPRFFFEAGGGPLFDVGPYYITQLVHLLGPVAEVTGMGRIGRAQRTVGSGANRGSIIDVRVPTTVYAILRFHCGALINFSASWDAVNNQHGPSLELFGTEGCLAGPTPNFFGGAVQVSHASSYWSDISTDAWAFGRPNYTFPSGKTVANHRGLGVIEMASGILAGRPHRANAALALHVLDVLVAIEQSSSSGKHLSISTHVERPAPLPRGCDEAVLFN